MIGTWTLFLKEVRRFWNVGFQTVAAPVITALLYLMIFGHVMQNHPKVYGKIDYVSFLVPGLIMMSVLQNAFANTSSSMIQSKVTGNLVFLLLSPLTPVQIFTGYVAASIMRGVSVGLGVLVVTIWFVDVPIAHIGWLLLFLVAGAALLGTMGLIAGVWAERFDQLAAFQNFIIMPATFLSGVFYSIESLPPFWQKISHFNPFFYMIDGFRYGFFGISDVPLGRSLAVVLIALFLLSGVALTMLKRGYKLRH